MALNSGMFWGRRSYLKFPGKITVEFMPAIYPGLKRGEFLTKLESDIEVAAERIGREAAKVYPAVASRLACPVTSKSVVKSVDKTPV